MTSNSQTKTATTNAKKDAAKPTSDAMTAGRIPTAADADTFRSDSHSRGDGMAAGFEKWLETANAGQLARATRLTVGRLAGMDRSGQDFDAISRELRTDKNVVEGVDFLRSVIGQPQPA